MTIDRPAIERARPEGLRIRRLEPSDAAGLMATMASPNAVRGTLQLPYLSLHRWHEKLARFDPDATMLVAEVSTGSDGPAIVGHASLMPVSATHSPRRRHAMSLGMSVRDDWQGQGIGSALLQALVDTADNWLNVLRIELTVFVDNVAAIALYRGHGFVVEGTHRAYALRDGAYVDVHAMARLHPRPPTIPSMVAEG